MSIRARLALFCAAALVVVLAMVGLAAFALLTTRSFVARYDALHHRLDVLTGLGTDIETYTEKAAAVLVSGRGERDALGAARIRLERTFASLTQATQAEVATLSAMPDIQAELPEVGNSRRMLELYHDIDQSTNQMLQLQRQNQPQQAALIFQRDVEFRLTNELQPLVGNSISTEQQQAAVLQQDIGDLQGKIGAAAIAIAVIGLLALGFTGTLLYRRLRAAVADGRAGAALVAELEATMAQLRDAQARLNATDTRQTQFLADIGHELRTPLTILRGEADVALRGHGGQDEQRASLERIRGQAAELGELLEQLLSYARPEGEPAENFADIALDEAVLAAVQEGEVLARPFEVAILPHLDDGGSHLEADFRRLKQALLIGLDNAVKHAPPGSEIGVETTLLDSQAMIRITDQGAGVMPEDLPHVFERFYRGRGEAEQINRGLGIGLAIAREIIERHRGTIALDNRPEGGAVLEIRLPLGDRIGP
jgi:signal transduction histidine kinase